ncbi:MAG: biotin/lipoyl-binding protein [Candidatus Syntrophopropionicum ammoniitolerans]
MDILKTTKTKKILTAFLFLAIITIILVLFFSLNKSRTAATAAQNNLTATGTVEARKVSASFKIPGRIENMLVAEGSEVQEGQELARLDSRELSAKLSQADGLGGGPGPGPPGRKFHSINQPAN